MVLNAQQKRNTTTTKSTTIEHEQLLNAQRSLRPLSPHFTIYQPQLTWYMSLTHRVTGAGLGIGTQIERE
ncbi:10600_t:CDS:2 [Entrophospora sp. SA101]|nr:10600_t:CDS:2 [Entrophospora sp. SA101]